MKSGASRPSHWPESIGPDWPERAVHSSHVPVFAVPWKSGSGTRPDAFDPPGRMAGQQNGRMMSLVVAAGCRNREGHTF